MSSAMYKSFKLKRQSSVLSAHTFIVEQKLDNIIVLNPNLDDLFNQSVYKLKVGDETCLVPLWHNELIYDKHKLQVQCEPELPENVQLDEYNNVHVWIKYGIHEIWEKETVDILLGTHADLQQVCRIRSS